MTAKRCISLWTSINVGLSGDWSTRVRPSEYLMFSGVPRRLGTYPLPGRVADVEQGGDFHTNPYCDAGGLSYVLDKSEGGFISIDTYDRSSCTIGGTFALTVIRKGPVDVYPYVDTLRFTEGQFRAQMITWVDPDFR